MRLAEFCVPTQSTSIKKDSFWSFIYGVDGGTCLGRSRLTAIPCFVFVISSLQTKALQPQLAPAEPTKNGLKSSPIYK